MNKGDERRAQYTINQLKELISNSTEVVNWYPHTEINGATVRGPWSRWFHVNDIDYGKEHVSSALNDAKYAAAAMNSLPVIVEDLDFLLSNFHKTEDKDYWEMMYQTITGLREKYKVR